ncbi:DUF481 domain-containing protein [Adhaeribacter pallidiroseus]|uniref:DUF481 domain-containing protein n=1 Tax=Adhaeribacter pallidiroseus TaxID=2072847 RepID=A0A369QFM1_9BACT|nr:DUF481 domain-containing protein [Adhaeribacter pallidiroseus]RDC62026.1 hypothetical protein AHMF7616_00616 [Adhaeribacter pallidiroseus]
MITTATRFNCQLLAFLFMWLTGPLYAQQPIVSPVIPVQPDTLLGTAANHLPTAKAALVDSLSYRFIGDGNFTRGNVNRSLLVLRAEITLQGPAVNISTNPRFTYGKQNRLLAERDTYVDLIVDVFKKKKVYVFGLGTIERSNLRRINWRRLAGAGVGFRLVQKERHNVSLTNAVIYESTDFQERPTLTTVRNSTRLKGRHSFLDDRMRLTHITFVQPALNNFSNLRWNTLISLEIPLNRWISMRGSFENSYESVVEATRKNNDSRITFGIAIGNKP